MGRLEGQVALITGAARGQGRSHALRLAEEGADIIAVDLCGQIASVGYKMSTLEDLEETRELVEKLGKRIVACQCDVRDGDKLKSIVADGLSEFGRIDIVIANAGIMPVVPPSGDSDDAFHDAIAVMLTGPWNTLRAAVPAIERGGRGGAVVITASMAALVSTPDIEAGVVGYFAAKSGLLGIMRCYAAALAPQSIRVNVVCPTGVATPMVVNDEFVSYAMSKPGVAASLSNAMPVPMIEPRDVSEAILYLVTDAGRYVTGIALPVDAGCQLAKTPG